MRKRGRSWSGPVPSRVAPAMRGIRRSNNNHGHGVNMQPSIWRSAREYLSKVLGVWWALMPGGVFTVVGALRELRVLPESVQIAGWLWLLLALLCFSVAQFVAFHSVRVERDRSLAERDEARHERDEARRRPAPSWMSFAEYEARAARLRGEWEINLPNPEGAQRYLREGWERDEIDGRPIVIGGKLDRPDHWPVRRRPPGHGLREDTKAALVAARSNTYRPHGFQYISGGPNPHLVTSSREWEGEAAMAIREELTSQGLAQPEPQEYGIYILTQRGREEAERLARWRRPISIGERRSQRITVRQLAGPWPPITSEQFPYSACWRAVIPVNPAASPSPSRGRASG